MPTNKADFSSLKAKWPSSFVAREEIHTFSGGIISTKYVANLDCRGLGPEGKVRVGRKVAYPVEKVIEWLQKRSSTE